MSQYYFVCLPMIRTAGGFSIGPPAEFRDGLPELATLVLVAHPQARYFRFGESTQSHRSDESAFGSPAILVNTGQRTTRQQKDAGSNRVRC